MVSIEPEEVHINIPWIDRYTLNKTINDRKLTLEQWKNESSNFKNDVSL
jgi:hypothetical protein